MQPGVPGTLWGPYTSDMFSLRTECHCRRQCVMTSCPIKLSWVVSLWASERLSPSSTKGCKFWHNLCFLRKPEKGTGRAGTTSVHKQNFVCTRSTVMALTKWEPFAGLTSLRREMDRLLEDFFDGGRRQELSALEPAVEVSETQDMIVVKAQLPGVSKDQIQVNISDDTLTIKGETKKEEKEEGKNYYRQEFHYGAFARTIT
ncbi:MAG: Hsp20/alpha crystallin family protein, partial [Candidatus Tectomicrobia bacterium]|nr:Hsp20/alpha crystallin family protein [Candidatus Tectomicrobia bacterium]